MTCRRKHHLINVIAFLPMYSKYFVKLTECGMIMAYFWFVLNYNWLYLPWQHRLNYQKHDAYVDIFSKFSLNTHFLFLAGGAMTMNYHHVHLIYIKHSWEIWATSHNTQWSCAALSFYVAQCISWLNHGNTVWDTKNLIWKLGIFDINSSSKWKKSCKRSTFVSC